MKKGLPVIGTCVLLAGLLMTVWGQTAPTDSPQRTVQARKGKALSSFVKPGQAELIVEKDESGPLRVLPPPGTQELEWITSLVQVVALIRVDTMTPTLTSDQDWIETRVSARVDDILKQPAGGPLSVGDSIQFVQDGGALTIGGVKVRAVLPWTEGFKQGRRYLVFGRRKDDTGDWLIEPGTAYEVNSASERLEPLAHAATARTEAGVELREAAARIRATIR